MSHFFKWYLTVEALIPNLHAYMQIKTICSEILGLTKLDWNTTVFSKQIPMTLGFAQSVGKVLSEIPVDITDLKDHYRFYMWPFVHVQTLYDTKTWNRGYSSLVGALDTTLHRSPSLWNRDISNLHCLHRSIGRKRNKNFMHACMPRHDSNARAYWHDKPTGSCMNSCQTPVWNQASLLLSKFELA